jgi:glutathione S-transferase
MGKVPAITDDGACRHRDAGDLPLPRRPLRRGPLRPADRRPAARALPALGGVRHRGAGAGHLPARPELRPRGVGWGDYDTALSALESALRPGPWLLGEMFSAADVAVGAVLTVAVYNKRVTGRPCWRPTTAPGRAARYQRALKANWPAS